MIMEHQILDSIEQFSIVHQNIRSMRRNFNMFVCELSLLKKKPILIFLTEVWIEQYELDNYKIEGYYSFGKFNESHRAGGTVVYMSSKMFDIFQYKSKSIEMLTADVIDVDLVIGNSNFSIICLYRLHGYTSTEFIQEFGRTLEKNSNKNLIVLGDINIDILADTSVSQDYQMMMASIGLKSQVNEITRNASSTCIDHLFIRQNIFSPIPICSLVHNFDFNDHSAIFVEFGSVKVTNLENNTFKGLTTAS